MAKSFNKIQVAKYLGKGHEFFTYMLFFALPWPDKFLPLSFVLWGSTWLLWRILSTKPLNVLSPSNMTVMYLFLAWVILGFVSVYFTDSPSEGGRLIETRIMCALTPIILLFGEGYLSKTKLTKALLLGCLSALSFYYLSFAYDYLLGNNIGLRFQLSSAQLVSHFSDFKHPAYLSLSLIISMFLYFNNSQIRRKLLPSSILYILFGVTIFVIQSRMGIVGFGLMSTILVLKYINNKFGLRSSVLASIPCLLLFVAFFFLQPKFEKLYNIQDGEINITEVRDVLWQSAVELISEKPLLGYGMRGAKEALVNTALINGVEDAVDQQLNAHNQFLQFALDNGVLGLSLFFLVLFLLVYQRKGFQGSSDSWMVVFVFAAFLTESMLERIAGVTLFTAVFYYLSLPHNLVSLNNDDRQKKMGLIYIFIGLLLFSLLLSLSLFAYDSHRSINPMKASSYAVGNHSIISAEALPISVPSELVGVDAVCYDSSSEGWLGEHGIFQHVPIKFYEIAEFDTVYFTSYCYVSQDFDGTWARISVDGINVGKQAVYYDLSTKGTWQKLSLSTVCSDGKVSLNLMMALYDKDSFSSMNGRVLFALPHYELKKY